MLLPLIGWRLDFGLAGRSGLLRDARHVLQPPVGTTAGAVPSVQRGGDSAQRLTALAHTADLIQHCLFGSVRLDVLSARPKPVMLPTRSPLVRLWLIASRVRSPIASRSHWLTAVMMFSTNRQPPSRCRATPQLIPTLSQVVRSAPAACTRSFTLRVSRSSLAMMTACTSPASTSASNRAMPVQGLGGFGAVYDDVD